MPELCNGNEVCSTCKKPHVAKLDGITCDCPYKVVIEHTDPQEAETAVALKYRQRARVAEKLNKIMRRALVVIFNDKHGSSAHKIGVAGESLDACDMEERK